MSPFEQYEDVGRRHRSSEDTSRSLLSREEGLLNGKPFECNLSNSRALTDKGILPALDIYDPKGNNDGASDNNRGAAGSRRDRGVFSRLDSDKNDEITAKEWVDRFDKAAGDDQVADRSEFKKEFGHGRQARRLFKHADADGDGQLTMDEWLQYFQKLAGPDGDTISRDQFRNAGRSSDGAGDGGTSGGGGGGGGSPEAQPESPYGGGGGGGGGGGAPEAPQRAPEAPEAPQRPGGTDAGGDIPLASDAQVQQLMNKVENFGASPQYMQQLRESFGKLPSSVAQAAIDGGTRIVAVGQGPAGLGGTYNSGSNTVTVYETSPFSTTATLSAEMFHNWDLNPTVGKHISSQPWFLDAYNRARQSGIDFGDDTFANRFEFIHHMARYYSGITDGANGQMMNFLGPEYAALTRQALLS